MTKLLNFIPSFIAFILALMSAFLIGNFTAILPGSAPLELAAASLILLPVLALALLGALITGIQELEDIFNVKLVRFKF